VQDGRTAKLPLGLENPTNGTVHETLFVRFAYHEQLQTKHEPATGSGCDSLCGGGRERGRDAGLDMEDELWEIEQVTAAGPCT
jgi:hypothetical protein